MLRVKLAPCPVAGGLLIPTLRHTPNPSASVRTFGHPVRPCTQTFFYRYKRQPGGVTTSRMRMGGQEGCTMLCLGVGWLVIKRGGSEA